MRTSAMKKGNAVVQVLTGNSLLPHDLPGSIIKTLDTRSQIFPDKWNKIFPKRRMHYSVAQGVLNDVQKPCIMSWPHPVAEVHATPSRYSCVLCVWGVYGVSCVGSWLLRRELARTRCTEERGQAFVG